MNDLVDRLRGKYVIQVNDGAGPLNGKDTFTRQFDTPPIHHEAAARIEALEEALRWYADSVNWRRQTKPVPRKSRYGTPGWNPPAAHIDKGARALFTLETLSRSSTSNARGKA